MTVDSPFNRDPQIALSVLEQRFGERLSRASAVRAHHSHTTSWIAPQLPDAVLFATSTADVAAAVAICAAHRLPVIPFGVGSSLEGHVNAPYGGLSIDMSQMNAVVQVCPEDLIAVVQPGVTRTALNAALRDTGLFFPIDPGADASLGGMASTRASGTNAVRYGTMRDAVQALEVVAADGAVIRTGGRAKKSSTGYDLTRLFVGAEGTLGVITELTVRLYGQPEAISGGVCPFPSIKAACDAVIMTIQAGVPVARIELLDAMQVRACNAYSALTLQEAPTLFLEFHGSPAGVEEQSALFRDIAADCGGGEFVWATRAEDRTKLWTARHNAYWASRALKPGWDGVSTDVCVPISQLADCVEETRVDMEAHAILAPLVGHVGDGNFHMLVLTDPAEPQQREAAEAFIGRLNERAIRMGGTCSGEHGIGQGKRKYLELEHGSGALAMMRAIKATLDPYGIMNPGKML